jgi:hypothetical protein
MTAFQSKLSKTENNPKKKTMTNKVRTLYREKKKEE